MPPVTAKSAALQKGTPRRFPQQFPQNPYRQIPMGNIIRAVLLTCASAVLHSLLRVASNDRLSPKCRTSTHTVAVPSGNLTRFSILPWGCYRTHRHSNGYLVVIRIASFLRKVNTDSGDLQRMHRCKYGTVLIYSQSSLKHHFLCYWCMILLLCITPQKRNFADNQ